MTDQQGEHADALCSSGGRPVRAVKRLVTFVIVGLLFGACGGGASGGSQVGTEAGLLNFLEQQKAALVSVDFEAMYRMQGEGCDYSLEEVTEGFQQTQALFLAFLGTTLGDLLADTEFEIASFDEDSLTAIVSPTYVGDDPALASLAYEDSAEYRFVNGSWTIIGADCIGAGVQGGAFTRD